MPLPTHLCQIRDEKRTVLADLRHKDVIREIWEHERRTAGEETVDPPPVTDALNLDPVLLIEGKQYKGVTYCVIEHGLPDSRPERRE
jgi:hypothetical protein